VIDLSLISDLPRFIRGDATGDGKVDISDAVRILSGLFLGGDAPSCVAASNTNGDDGADISDAVYLLGYLFLGGPSPVNPFPGCGLGVLPVDEAMKCTEPTVTCR
jgi:hypothetical protein